MSPESTKNVNLPSNINPHAFTTLVWDTIDRLEVTLSESGTSHRINCITIQPEFIGPQLPVCRPHMSKTNKRYTNDQELHTDTKHAGENWR